MKTIPSKFEKPLSKLKKTISDAETHLEPAVYCFMNDLRTPLFRIQGLARVYRNLHNPKAFEQILENTKSLEDSLGEVDFHISFYQSFKSDKEIPVAYVDFFKSKAYFALDNLKEHMHYGGWNNGECIEWIEENLLKANWLPEKKEIKGLQKVFESEIEKIISFINEIGFPFTDIENHVHELRRKLRWLSIYAFALDGAIQLKKEGKTPTNWKKYQTEDVVKSPFNVMSEPIKDQRVIFFNQEAFYALSWVINELGILKDIGLKQAALKEAIQYTQLCKNAEAEEETRKLLGTSTPTKDDLLQKASTICEALLKDNILTSLIIPTEK